MLRWRRPIPKVKPARPPPTIVMGLLPFMESLHDRKRILHGNLEPSCSNASPGALLPHLRCPESAEVHGASPPDVWSARCATNRWLNGPAERSRRIQPVWLGHKHDNSLWRNPACTLTGASWRVTALQPMNPTSLLKKSDANERRGSRATKKELLRAKAINNSRNRSDSK